MNLPALKHLEEIMLSVENLSAQERSAYLQEMKGKPLEAEARFLVNVLEGDDDFLEEPISMPTGDWSGISDETLPERIGPYKILDLLGRGGMGTVYLAWQQEPVPRKVALKVLHALADPHSRNRMAFEVEAMARLNHANVAGVLDVGATEDGATWFTMPYFPGQAISRFCAQENLSISARVALFRDVCEGIGHLHRKGLIHRDLKPSNILAARQGNRNHVKIIDFGIARGIAAPISQATMDAGPHAILGTLDYMSPEQTQGSDTAVDTRSDIYSAAAVLYEMLCGVPPLSGAQRNSGSLEQILWAIREEDPVPPSRRVLQEPTETISGALKWSRQLDGELDWIVARAMHKHPRDRYAGIDELSEDLGRYLKGLPVVAGPLSRFYYLRKFVNRNRLMVTAAGVSLLVLVAATLFSSWSFFQMREARDQAVMQVSRFNAQNEFILETLTLPNPLGGNNKDIKLVTALDQAVVNAERQYVNFPELLIDTYFTTAQSFKGLGETGKAEQLLRDVLQRSALTYGHDHPIYQKIALELAYLLLEVNLEDMEESLNRLGPVQSNDLRYRQDTLRAHLLRKQGHYDEALHHYADLLQRRPEKDASHLEVLRGMANAYERTRDYAQAEDFLNRALEMQIKLYETDAHHEVLNTLNNLANIYAQTQDYPKALDVHHHTLAIREPALGENHPFTAITHHNIGYALFRMLDYEESLPHLAHAARVFEEQYGLESPNAYIANNNLGRAIMNLGRHDHAIAHFHFWADRADAYLCHSKQADYLKHNLGKAYYEAGKYRQAVTVLEPFLAARIQKNRPMRDITETRVLLGRAYVFVDGAKAIMHLRRALADVDREDGARVAVFQARLGFALFTAGSKKEGWSLLKTARQNSALPDTPAYQQEVLALCAKTGLPQD